MQGQIPNLKKLGKLTDLAVDDNKFDGTIPKLPGSLVYLEIQVFLHYIYIVGENFFNLFDFFTKTKGNSFTGGLENIPNSVKTCTFYHSNYDGNCFVRFLFIYLKNKKKFVKILFFSRLKLNVLNNSARNRLVANNATVWLLATRHRQVSFHPEKNR